MSTEVGKIHYDLNIKKDKFDSAYSGIKSKLGSISDGIATIAKGVAVAGTAMGAFGAIGLKAWDSQEKALTQLDAVLKSTKNAIGLTKDEAINLSGAMQKVTTYADEVVLGGENLLLTFTNIGKDIFPQATEVMLDMSTALGQDVKSSAIQLGKALQDPILGVTALRRVGVNFNSAQQEVIKKLVETGHAAEAQAMILKELSTEFGGSARAAAQTFGGQLTQVKNILGDFMEEVGKFLAAHLRPMIQGLIDWTNRMGGVEGVMTSLTNFIKSDVFPVFRYVGNVLSQWIENIRWAGEAIATYLLPKFKALYNTIVGDVVPALKELWQKIGIPFAKFLGITLVGVFGLAIDIINVFGKALPPVIDFVIKFKEAFIALGVSLSVIKAINLVQLAVTPMIAQFGAVIVVIRSVIASFELMIITMGTFKGIWAALTIYMQTNPLAVVITAVVVAFTALSKAISSHYDKIITLNEAQAKLADEMAHQAANQFKQAKNAYDTLNDSALAYLDTTKRLNDAEQALKDAQEKLTAVTKKYGGDSQQAKDASASLAEQEARLAQIQLDRKNQLDELVNKVKEMTSSTGALKQQTLESLNADLKSAEAIKAQSSARGEDTTNIQKVIDTLNGLIKIKDQTVKVDANTTDAQNQLNVVKGMMDNLPLSKNFNVQVTSSGFQGVLDQITKVGSGLKIVSGGGLSFRAMGGPVSSNTPYVVGERGPEMFVPRSAGSIVPNDQLGMGGSTNIYGDINIADKQTADYFFAKLSRNQELSMRGLSTMAGSVG